MGLTLSQALRLQPRVGISAANHDRESASVAFVGAGGKTTSLFKLARQLGRPVIVTTTTHLGSWQAKLADRHVIARSTADLEGLGKSEVTLITGQTGPDDRLLGPDQTVLHALHEIALANRWDLLVEADGARQRPLKAPGRDEPQVPPFVEIVVVVAGLHGLGAVLSDETVHRSGNFASLSGLAPWESITPGSLLRVLLSEHGGLQGIPPGARRIALLNQVDSEGLQAQAHGMAGPLLGAYNAVVVANMQASIVHAVFEKSAGIVLAAGDSTRFGAPKQLALWRGETFVRISARSALEAGLDPVVVITGANAEQVQGAVHDLPVHIVENREWREGQASSVRAGVQALPTDSAAAVFLLADQPLITAAVIRSLVDAHSTEAACIVAPLIDGGQRANPVLFDRETFGPLRELHGDAGGRSIFANFPIHHVPWHNSDIARDIDTPDDYRKLLETGE